MYLVFTNHNQAYIKLRRQPNPRDYTVRRQELLEIMSFEQTLETSYMQPYTRLHIILTTGFLQ